MTNASSVKPELVIKVYTICFDFAVSFLGNKKSGELLRSSYETIQPYFQSLEKFSVDKELRLRVNSETLTEKELLAFTVWIQQFIRELKNYLVGLGNINIEKLTGEIQDELEATGFYEYYRQAQELEY